jgi:transposase InsO family protein
VKKLGNIPAGGGWRLLGRQAGKANRHLDGGRARSRYRNPLIRYGFIHVVLDDHTRLAYAEICEDETGPTAAAVLHRATAWFADRGVIARRVLTDNGGCYRSRDWATACAELGIAAKRTRPYRPQWCPPDGGHFKVPSRENNLATAIPSRLSSTRGS